MIQRVNSMPDDKRDRLQAILQQLISFAGRQPQLTPVIMAGDPRNRMAVRPPPMPLNYPPQ
jgi:hypothetical protein